MKGCVAKVIAALKEERRVKLIAVFASLLVALLFIGGARMALAEETDPVEADVASVAQEADTSATGDALIALGAEGESGGDESTAVVEGEGAAAGESASASASGGESADDAKEGAAQSSSSSASESSSSSSGAAQGVKKAPAAGARAVHNDVITSITATLRDGSGDLETLGQRQTFRLNATFALPDGQIKEGDTTVITLPEKLEITQTFDFDITDGNGNVVARAVVDPGAKSLTLTYTDYPETHSNVSGQFHFYSRVDRTQVDGPEDIDLNFDISGKVIYGGTVHFEGIGPAVGHALSKSGWVNSTEPGNQSIRYQLSVNTLSSTIHNLVVSDQIRDPGFEIDPDSVVILRGTWVDNHGDWGLRDNVDVTADYAVNFNGAKDGFTISLGDTEGEGFLIRYTAKANYALVDGEVIHNDATVEGSDLPSTSEGNNSRYLEGGGSAEGYVYTINLHKTGADGASLAGATFDVVRVSSGAIVGTITTDANGMASLGGLLRDNYELVETEPPAGYVSLTDPIRVNASDFDEGSKAVTVTAVNELGTTSFKVSKQWVGPVAGPVTITLTADGEEVDTVELNAANEWSATFDGLQKYASDGHEIEYDALEAPVAGYSTNPVKNGDNDITFVNTNTETVEVSGSKTWDDADDQDGVRPASITVNLYADNGADPIDSKTVTADDNWSWSFTGLPKYDLQDNHEIAYRIDESPVDGYTPEYSGYDITNTHTPEIVVISGSKTWDDADDQDGMRPESITVRLSGGGIEWEQTVTAEDGWAWTFANLPKFKDGVEIEYVLSEDAIPDYSATYDGFYVKNTHTPGKTSVTVNKVWDDADNQDGLRPASITVELVTGEGDAEKSLGTLELTADNNWTGSFTDLDEYANGQKIEYRVQEVGEITGYTSAVSGDAVTGFTVTNVHLPETIVISGSKTWDDADDQDGIRPESITVHLYADGGDTPIASKTVTADDDWSWTFADLPKFKDGVEIEYTIAEDEVDGYSATYDGYNITNTHTPGGEEPGGGKYQKANKASSAPAKGKGSPLTGDTALVGVLALVAIAAGGAALALAASKKRKRGRHSA